MFSWFGNRSREAIVERVYGEIVAQARRPSFYLDLAVPDTIEGRFDLNVLHLFLLMNRAAGEDATTREAAQAVCDRFFTETDRALREMGVGDLGVPKRMKKLAGLYAGRAKTYTAALAAPDDGELAAALSRTIYLVEDGSAPAASLLARYVRAATAHLGRRPALEQIERGVTFPDPKETMP